VPARSGTSGYTRPGTSRGPTTETFAGAARSRLRGAADLPAGVSQGRRFALRMNKVTRLTEACRAYVLGTIKLDTPSGDRAVRARHYRFRAEELRVISEEVLLRETSRTLLSLADSYEQIAIMVENGFAGDGAGSDESESA
jgi:hypothetical protein